MSGPMIWLGKPLGTLLLTMLDMVVVMASRMPTFWLDAFTGQLENLLPDGYQRLITDRGVSAF